MRIDKFLKNARIIKRRTISKQACDSGRISINNKICKAGDNVKIGDLISIQFAEDTLEIVVKDLIDNPKKEDSSKMYEKREG